MNCVLMKIMFLKAVFQLIRNVRQVESNSDCNENHNNDQLVKRSLNPDDELLCLSIHFVMRVECHCGLSVKALYVY